MALDPIDEERLRIRQITRFAGILAVAATILAAVPTLLGLMSAPPGSLYFGIQTNLDDHMVYAAWMRQAMDGHVFFDNRFAVDPQPGLTVNLYFFVLGLIAKAVGIPAAMTLARLALTYLFVRLFGRFLARMGTSVFGAKAMLMMACFGGGLGFATWETFGQDYVNGPEAVRAILGPLLLGRAPIDVWQPEAFVFPSMLTNSLFMAALCLIVWTLMAAIEARNSWRPVLGGALAYGLLMNIHSYDALLVFFVLVAFLVTQVVQRQATWAWAGRVACIGLGAAPAAAWFLYVLARDPVFQARAATLTLSPNFRQVVFGILPALLLALIAAWRAPGKSQRLGFACLSGILAVLLVASRWHDPSHFFLEPVSWAALFAAGLVTVALIASTNLTWNLAWSWAIAGLLAIYFPALFQRKLSMGLMVPWGMLAGQGLVQLLRPFDRSTRNLVASLSLLVACASSILWFQREIVFIRADVGRTAVHSVYYSKQTGRILDILNGIHGRAVVVAMPGVWTPIGPANFATPQISDLNPILSGMTGVYTFAGHWSETPDYGRRRGMAMALFLADTPAEVRRRILDAIRPDYLVAPNPKAFPSVVLGDQRLSIADLSSFGEVVYEGTNLELIKVRR